ncbi:DNA-directed RNA polymerase subunit omega [Cytophagaceae bacterium AH-315-L13]|nr:DNA-directed RNA polymerase subunit omega [Cytophagaceae bacterium AH-315-L13]
MDRIKQYAHINPEAITRNSADIEMGTGNLYEAISVISKRANQLSIELKEELHEKLAEFDTTSDNLEEIFENTEQIELSRFYEKLPKPTLVATVEYLEGKVYHRNPENEVSEDTAK